MNNRRNPRMFRPKAWTWLERDAHPALPHVTIDPSQVAALSRADDEEGRFVVERDQEGAGPTRWVGDRRHWTEIPPPESAE